MADGPGGAERQLAVFERTGDLAAVARHLAGGPSPGPTSRPPDRGASAAARAALARPGRSGRARGSVAARLTAGRARPVDRRSGPSPGGGRHDVSDRRVPRAARAALGPARRAAPRPDRPEPQRPPDDRLVASPATAGASAGSAPRPGPTPGLLKSILPLWSDENGKTAPHAILSGSIVGHIRYASPNIETCLTNTPLYVLDDHLWTINGDARALARAALQGDPRPARPGPRGRPPGLDRRRDDGGALADPLPPDRGPRRGRGARGRCSARPATWPASTTARSRRT